MPAGFEILHEDGPVLVVNKSAGVATQAPPQFDSLEAQLRRFLAERSGEASPYLGVPHRLDRPVSGVMLFATKRRAAFRLSRQFERRTIGKCYWACVNGFPAEPSGTWTDHLWKVYGQPRTMIVEPTHPGAQQAILHYRTIGTHRHGVCLEISLETGRTHQIRIQSSSRGHAIVGDQFYGSTTAFGPAECDERERPIALHARSISFLHLTSGERIEFSAPLPPAWDELGLTMADA